MSVGLEKVLLEEESFQAICVAESGIVHLKTASGTHAFC